MKLEFYFGTISDTIGELIQASQQCRKLRQPKGVKSRIYCKLYDTKGNLVSSYSSSVNDWKKHMIKDMKLIKRGSIEAICNPHPY